MKTTTNVDPKPIQSTVILTTAEYANLVEASTRLGELMSSHAQILCKGDFAEDIKQVNEQLEEQRIANDQNTPCGEEMPRIELKNISSYSFGNFSSRDTWSKKLCEYPVWYTQHMLETLEGHILNWPEETFKAWVCSGCHFATITLGNVGLGRWENDLNTYDMLSFSSRVKEAWEAVVEEVQS